MNAGLHFRAAWLITSVIGLSLPLCAQTTSVKVVNGGFETGSLTGWSTVASSGYGSGVSVINNVTNQSAQYPNFSNPLPGTGSGTYYASVTGYNGNPAEVLYQDVSANGQGNGTLKPNTTYILTVAMGVGKYSVPNNAYIELINGTAPTGTVLATGSVSSLGMGNYANNFENLTVTFTTGATVSGDLTVAIGTTFGYPTVQGIYVDNVTLTESAAGTAETIGGGTIANPALGPAPSFNLGGGGYTLVKNWHFGTDGTIPNIAVMNQNFQYHDQFNVYNNGNGNYGANIVAPDSADALAGQPVENVNTATPVRTFFTDYMQTYIVPLNGATTCTPSAHNAGSGSFQAKWTLPNGGALLGQDIVWETRVRYVTPPYFWFSIWTSGNQWNNGAEMDLIESFGYDNPDGATNYNGDYWHSNSVHGTDASSYANWPTTMASYGITNYDPTQYHIWSLVYNKDNSYVFYVDGIKVQSGPTYYWTLGATGTGTPVNMSFIFDGTWGHTQVASVDFPLAATAFTNTFYEWNYSRVYLRQAPVFANSLPAQSIAAGAAFNFAWQATSATPVAYTLASGTLPPGLSLSSAGVLSGAPTTGGAYTGTISVSNGVGSSATQAFSLTVLNTFSSWASTYFTAQQLSDPNVGGPNSTPQGDGASNFFKFLYDINPTRPMTAADQAALPTVSMTSSAGQKYLCLTYRQNALLSGVTINLQSSPDLQTWTTVTPDISQQIGTDSVTGDPILQLGVNVTNLTHEFLKLKATTP
jgi:hypothetical protein